MYRVAAEGVKGSEKGAPYSSPSSEVLGGSTVASITATPTGGA